MKLWRVGFLLALHAIPVFYLLRGGLTPLDALVLSWAEGLIAISLNRIRLAVHALRAQPATPEKQNAARRRRKRRRSRKARALADLARSLLGGLLLYSFLGTFAFGAIFVISGDTRIPWTLTSETFWTAAGWMALAAVAEGLVTLTQLTRQGPAAALFDQRTIAMLLRFLADYILLVFGALLIVAFDIPTAAVVALIVVKVAIDIAAESWSAWINRRRPAASTPSGAK